LVFLFPDIALEFSFLTDFHFMYFIQFLLFLHSLPLHPSIPHCIFFVLKHSPRDILSFFGSFVSFLLLFPLLHSIYFYQKLSFIPPQIFIPFLSLFSLLFSLKHISNFFPYPFLTLISFLQFSFTSLPLPVLSRAPGSSVGIATELPGWKVRDRIPVGTRISARPDRPWGPPSLL